MSKPDWMTNGEELDRAQAVEELRKRMAHGPLSLREIAVAWKLGAYARVLGLSIAEAEALESRAIQYNV